MTRSQLFDRPAEIIEYWQSQLGIVLSTAEREVIERALTALSEQLQPLQQLAVDSTIVDRELKRWAAAMQDPEIYPGSMIAHKLAWELPRQGNRTRLRSDLVDIEHVSYLPYVDVATCDGAVINMIRQHTARNSGPRKFRILRSGHVADVIKEIRNLGSR
jgi:hypothetical protein